MEPSLAQLNKRFFLGLAIHARVKATSKYLSYAVTKAKDYTDLSSLAKAILIDLKDWSVGPSPSLEAQLCLRAMKLAVGDELEMVASIESGLSSLTEVVESLQKDDPHTETSPESSSDTADDTPSSGVASDTCDSNSGTDVSGGAQ